MAARIVHFGADECARMTVLTSAGYEVEGCGTSLALLREALQNNPADLVAVSESATAEIDEAVSLSRANTPAPLILFEDASRRHETLAFDVIVPPLTPPADWLGAVAVLISRSREIVKHSQAVRVESAKLRKASADAVAQSTRERQRSIRSRRNPDKPIKKDPSNLS